mgnify:FL=1
MGFFMLKFSPVVKRTTVQSNENTFLEKRTPKRADMWKGLIKKGKKVLTRASKSDKMFKRSKEERKTNLEN